MAKHGKKFTAAAAQVEDRQYTLEEGGAVRRQSQVLTPAQQELPVAREDVCHLAGVRDAQRESDVPGLRVGGQAEGGVGGAAQQTVELVGPPLGFGRRTRRRGLPPAGGPVHAGGCASG